MKLTKLMLTLIFLPLAAACSGGSSPGGFASDAALPFIAGIYLGGNSAGGCPVAEWPFTDSDGNPQGAFLADSSVNPEIRGDTYGDPLKATNGVCGGGFNGGSLDVYSLGSSTECESGENCIVLEWKDLKVLNAPGIDFVVYENAFAFAGGGSRFIEAVIAEVSNDRAAWCGWNPDYSGTTDITDLRNSDYYTDLAGVWPVYFRQDANAKTEWQVEDLFTETTDDRGTYLKGGGDGFDLNASTFGSTGSGCTAAVRDNFRADGFTYLRLTTANSRDSTAFPLGADSFDKAADIDGVIVQSTGLR